MLLGFAGATLSANAQTGGADSTVTAVTDTVKAVTEKAKSTKTKKAPTNVDFQQFAMSAGINAGSNGLGAQYNIAVLPYLTGRVQGSYAAKKNYTFDTEDSGTNVNNDLSVTTGFVGLFADGHLPDLQWLSLSLGVVYDFTTINLVQNVTGAAAEDLGKLTLDVKVNNVNPYMGLMFGNPIPKKRVNVGFQLGTYYVGSPKVTWVGEGIVGPTADQADIVEDNLKDYSWMPVLALHLNIKLN